MGNCIVLQKEVIRVIRPDGEFLEYKAPRKVRHVLSEFAGHAISDTLPVIRHLHPDANMVAGREYYLLPLPAVVPTGTEKKAITFSKPDVAVAEFQKEDIKNGDDDKIISSRRWKPKLESIPEVN